MPASSDENSPNGRIPTADGAVFVLPARTGAALVRTDVVERRAIKGTVDATIQPVEPHFYNLRGEPLIMENPYGAAGIRKTAGQASGPVRPSAVDLISELQEISGQVNRMMAQVERAIDRLSIHAG